MIKLSTWMATIVILLALIVSGVGAKDIIVSNGISLSDTPDNRTVELKQVIPDLKVAPPSLSVKAPSQQMVKGKMQVDDAPVEDNGIIYSESPVSDAIVNIISSDDRSSYKSEYIAKYSNIVGNNNVIVNGKIVSINIKDIEYIPDGRLQMNLSASVDGVSKKVRNPYKIVNPPVSVYTSDTTFFPNKTLNKVGDIVESPDNAILISIANLVIKLSDGEPTFGDPDPTLQIYQTTMSPTTGTSFIERTNNAGFNDVITGVGTSSSSIAQYCYVDTEIPSGGGYFLNDRCPMTFNTSSLGSSVVGNASISIYPQSNTQITTYYAYSYLGFTRFHPASNTVYATSDYQTNETILYSNPIRNDSFLTGGYVTSYFTTTGLSMINNTGLTWMMGRTSMDYSSDSSHLISYYDGVIYPYYSFRYTGTTRDPYLTIEYGVLPTPTFITQVEGKVNTNVSLISTTDDSSIYVPNLYSNWSIGNRWVNITGGGRQNATPIFSTPGIYNTTLYVTNAVGTGSSSMQDVIVLPVIESFVADQPVSISSNSITFTPTVNTTIQYYNWSFGDNSWTNTTSTGTVSHTYSTTGIYSPSLYLYNSTMGLVNSTTNSEYIGINSMKYYPTTDGYVSNTSANVWATIRSGIGTSADSAATTAYSRQTATSSASTYNTLDRRIEIYNVTANPVPGGYTIVNASLNFYGNSHSSTFGTNPNYVVMNVSSLASLDSISASDYNKLGITALSNSNITYANYVDAGYNRMFLNTAGILLINSTTSKIPFMFRTNWDADNSPPTWSTSKTAYFRPYTSEQAGTTQDPYLLVNFTASPVYFIVNGTVGMIGANAFQFNDTSPTDGGTYNWSFGDGTYSVVRNATHTYATQSLFTVTFTSPAGGGSFSTQNNLINISAPSFYCDPPLTGATPLTVTCYDSSAILTGDTHWIWGDGTSSDGTGTPMTHTYIVTGNFNVQMRSPSATGDIATINNYIHSGVFTPSASFTSNVTSVSAGGYVQFNDTSSNSPTSWAWDFTNDTVVESTLQNPVYQYNTVGNYTVNFTATNGAGSDKEIIPNYIRVYPSGWYPGIVPITSASISLGSNYSYGNVQYNPLFLSSVSGSTPYTYAWIFGDGGTSTAANPQHQYNTVGTYLVQVNVSNPISFYKTNLSTPLVIYGAGIPYANYYAQPTTGTPGALISFVDQSLKGNLTNLVYNWSFGDGIYTTTPYSAIQGNVQHVYTYSGVYDTNLSITNMNGTSYMFKQQYITISTSQANTWYSPHQVSFKIVDMNGQSMNNVIVNATAYESTLPGGITGAVNSLISNFGISQAAAQTMVDTAVHMNGTTDDGGKLTFTMMGSLKYLVIVTDASGASYSLSIYPIDNYYTMTVNEQILQSPTQVNNTYSNIANTSLTFSEPNTSYMTMGVDYTDLSGYTNYIQFYILNKNNNTIMYNVNRSVVGVTRVLINQTFLNSRGDQYTYWYDAHRTV